MFVTVSYFHPSLIFVSKIWVEPHMGLTSKGRPYPCPLRKHHDTQHSIKNTTLSIKMLSKTPLLVMLCPVYAEYRIFYCYAECRNAKCRFAECRGVLIMINYCRKKFYNTRTRSQSHKTFFGVNFLTLSWKLYLFKAQKNNGYINAMV